MRRLVRDNALAMCFLLLFLLSLAGQSVAGTAAYNEDQVAEGGAPVTWLQYVTSSTFAVDVAENRQSEYLQFFLYILGIALIPARHRMPISAKKLQIATFVAFHGLGTPSANRGEEHRDDVQSTA